MKRVVWSVLLLLAALTYQRAQVWRSDLTLWADAMRQAPTSPRVVVNVAIGLAQAGRDDEATPLFRRAIACAEGRWPRAQAVWTWRMAYWHLGRMAAEDREHDEAISDFGQMVRPVAGMPETEACQ